MSSESEKRTPYYPPEVPGKPPWDWLTPEFFVARQRLLDLPGARVETPQGKVWDIRAFWEGGEGGPPQGSVVVVPEPEPFQERCLAHLQPEPCPVCAGYIAAGL